MREAACEESLLTPLWFSPQMFTSQTLAKVMEITGKLAVPVASQVLQQRSLANSDFLYHLMSPFPGWNSFAHSNRSLCGRVSRTALCQGIDTKELERG